MLAPVREWNLKNLNDKLTYARRRHLPIAEPTEGRFAVDRNLWGTSLYQHDLYDAWLAPPEEAFVLTRPPEKCPDEPAEIIIGFERGVPCSLDGTAMDLLPLVRELNRVGGEHGIGRSDVVEDRMLGIKSREFYEAPTPTLLLAAHPRSAKPGAQPGNDSAKRKPQPPLCRAGLHGPLVSRGSLRSAGLLRVRPGKRHWRGASEAVQGIAFRGGPPQPPQSL